MPRIELLGRSFEISGISIDSRSVRAGDCFVALRGEHVDGHAYVAQAAKAGAALILVEHDVPENVEVPIVKVASTPRTLAHLAAAFYGEPSAHLDIVGVTGTNGKTTTTHLLAGILAAAHRPCGIIGTIGASFGERTWELAHTTPFAHELQALLARMRDAGAQAVAMEVSSHALALDRVAAIPFRVGVFTNLTRDHLDHHLSMDAYAQAKRSLFVQTQAAVLCVDDEYGRRWVGELRGTMPVLGYAIEREADLVARELDLSDIGSSFSLDGRRFDIHLPGRFNVGNALAAIGAARLLGIDDAISAVGIAALLAVSGRMERVGNAEVRVIVDYAHTPDALKSALAALRETTRGKLLLVFGCGGDRDRGKRSQMGAIAARLADGVYLTSDNPRGEDPMQIIDEIRVGMGSVQVVVEIDRARAIMRAIGEAGAGDVVLIAGKGHERYQLLGSQRIAFDDREVAQRALAARSVAS